MRSVLRRSTGMLARAALALLVLGLAGGAEARVETLVWEHPDPAQVAGFKLHYGTASGSYTEVLDVGLPPRASDGSFSHDLSVADDLTIYVAVSAYAADGRVSPLSNERVREGIVSGGGTDDTGSGGTADPGTGGSTDPDSGGSTDPGSGGTGDGGSGGSTDPGGSSDPIGSDPNTLWYEDFEASSQGSFVPQWLDTAAGNSLVEDDSLFSVLSLGGDQVLGTTSPQTDIHSHYVGSGSESWSSYEVRGRLRVSDASGRIGIASHSRYPDEDAYYRFSTAWKTGELEIQSHPWRDEVGMVCPSPGTGVIVQPDRWYRVRFRVEIGSSATEMRAKAWPEGQPEPGSWQARCSYAGVDLPLDGTIGLWSGSSGSKFWDDLEVVALPPEAGGGGSGGTLTPPDRPILLID